MLSRCHQGRIQMNAFFYRPTRIHGPMQTNQMFLHRIARQKKVYIFHASYYNDSHYKWHKIKVPIMA